MSSHMDIEAIGLEKSYGDRRVLRGVDLQVRAGTVYALLGPNGAGKTTTVRIMATLIPPDGGSCRVAGLDVVSQRSQVRRRISLTGQYAALDDGQTGVENLVMMGCLSGLAMSGARRRAEELLERFDLVAASRQRVCTYSGGMRRRLDLAASLVAHPTVIFLDEPTTGLDLRSRQAMWDLISDLAASGVTILLTTQYLDEADLLADRIAVLDAGSVVAEGTPAELKRSFGTQRLDLTPVDAAAFECLVGVLGTRAIRSDPGTLTIGVPTTGSSAHVRALLDEIDTQGSALERFAVRQATLDDVFLALTGHSTPDIEKETIRV